MTEPLRLIGIVDDEIVAPKLVVDRSVPHRVISTYDIPFQLSRLPTKPESQLILSEWRSPNSNPARNDFGTLKVEGDRLIITNTTVETVQRSHLATIRSILSAVRTQTRLSDEREAAQKRATEALRAQVREAAATMNFGTDDQ